MSKASGCTCAAITFIILGGLALLIAWLADKMKSPTFTIDQVTVNGYNFSTTTNHLNATFTVAVRSHNRDSKYKIKYHVVAVSVYHTSDYALGFETLGPYSQGHGSYIIFSARPVARDVPVTDPEVARAIREENRVGEVRVEVRVRASVRYEVKGWKHKHFTLKTNQSTNCDVDRF
ncbi:hypothetical protein RND81_07G068600 [Saponaria officinalis]|uniref:Late embryogenesis abundant protein LEA-2 subgroup domain-containing protein n=1 Tax=Saponaria officinalis TaxID=3572 RepID=A0AAW1JNA8_SAPOF